MKSKLKFGNYVVNLTGKGRSRLIALFDYSKVPAGHLVSKLASAEINAGRTFDLLDARQSRIVLKWVNARSRPLGASGAVSAAGKADADRRFPAEKDVLHQFLIQTQGPISDITSNEDGELSSRAVTQWYVKKYCEMNHLTV